MTVTHREYLRELLIAQTEHIEKTKRELHGKHYKIGVWVANILYTMAWLLLGYAMGANGN